MNKAVIKLSDEELKQIEDHFESVSYELDIQAIYQGHIPCIGLVLLDGKIDVKKKNKELALDPGSLVAVKELYHSQPFSYDLHIRKSSVVVVLDRTSLDEILTSKPKNKILYNMFKKIIS